MFDETKKENNIEPDKNSDAAMENTASCDDNADSCTTPCVKDEKECVDDTQETTDSEDTVAKEEALTEDSEENTEQAEETVEETEEPLTPEQEAFERPIKELFLGGEGAKIESKVFFDNTNESKYTDGSEKYLGGMAYTKNVDGTVANGYEWPAKKSKKDKKKAKAKSNSDKGYKAFVISILSVFVLAIVVMSGFVVYHIMSLHRENAKNDNVPVSSFTDSGIVSGSGKNNPAPQVPNNKEQIPKSEKDSVRSDTNQSAPEVSQDIPKTSDSQAAPDSDTNDTQAEQDTQSSAQEASPPLGFAPHDSNALSIPEVAAKCSPSTVGIISQVEITESYPFFFSPSTSIAEASGSGFIYSADGYIITNHHVIEDAKKITVVLYDGSEYEAELIGSDRLSDVALIKITPNETTTLIPMEIGNSDEVVVGEPVVAIGCPAGIEFIGTVTDGIISAINRDIEITDDYGRVQKVMTLIQTNATINHGNSGGPLINTCGQVIGINTLKLAQDYEGIGFSIPINGAVNIINQLIEHGEVVERTDNDFVSTKGVIGITGTEISESEAEYYEIPRGVLVSQIDKNCSAAQNGLRRGDIITHYNGKEVFTVQDINDAKGNARAGDSATVTVYRIDNDNNGTSFDITFELMAQE